MDLHGKKLLLMGGAAFGQDLRAYADEQGFEMIAVGKDISRLKIYADEAYAVDTQDVDMLGKLVDDKRIDGIFVGTTEVNIPPAIELSKRTGAHFYVSTEQWSVLADKRKFKKIMETQGLNTIPEYSLEDTDGFGDADNLQYPVLVKPADSSGARGITVANNKKELKESYEYAKSYSKSDTVLIERLMQDMDDTFIRYHFQNGEYSISSSFDRYVNKTQGGFGGIGIAYTHPSRHLQAFIDKCDEKCQEVFKNLGLMNGVITLQCFVDENEEFYFYEAGYRLGGSQSYIFTNAVNHSNSLHYMLNYAMTGEMAEYKIAERDNPFFATPCVNLYIALKPGRIEILDGVDKVRAMPGVLNVTELLGVGSVIEKTGSLSQVCMRMHIMGNDSDDINNTLKDIYDNLDIRDENGNDMLLERFVYTER